MFVVVVVLRTMPEYWRGGGQVVNMGSHILGQYSITLVIALAPLGAFLNIPCVLGGKTL